MYALQVFKISVKDQSHNGELIGRFEIDDIKDLFKQVMPLLEIQGLCIDKSFKPEFIDYYVAIKTVNNSGDVYMVDVCIEDRTTFKRL